MSSSLEVWPFSSPSEFEAMVDYFVGSSDEFLLGMGIDLQRVPTRAEWLAAVLADAALPDPEKNRFYVGWHLDGRLVGHSSISHIVHGVSAHCHLHLWDAGLRKAGLGPEFLALSIDEYFRRFGLQSIACEPSAENPAPNAVLPKLGFRRVRRYRTVATSMSGEIEVNRYEVSREEWAANAARRPGKDSR